MHRSISILVEDFSEDVKQSTKALEDIKYLLDLDRQEKVLREKSKLVKHQSYKPYNIGYYFRRYRMFIPPGL